MMHACCAQSSALLSSGNALPNLISTRVPTGKSILLTWSTFVLPSYWGRRVMRRLRVQTVSLPSDASTVPATTRSPLPSAPLVGSRNSLVDTNGRLIENSRAMSSGEPSIPRPMSSTK